MYDVAMQHCQHHRAFQLLSLVAITWLVTTTAHADEVSSVDGGISVAEPDAARFARLEPGVNFSGSWMRTDGTCRLGIWDAPRPAGTIPPPGDGGKKMFLEDVSEGFAKAFNGRVMKVESTDVGPYQIVTTIVAGTLEGQPFTAKMSLFASQTRLFKLMSLGIGIDVETDLDTTRFFNSAKINVPTSPSKSQQPSTSATPPSSQPQQQQPQPLPNDGSANNLTKYIGLAGLLGALVAAVAIMASYRKKKAMASSQNPPSTAP